VNIIIGNVNNIANEVGTKADVLAPIISLFGGAVSTTESVEELALVA
jgi:hypothetical protein